MLGIDNIMQRIHEIEERIGIASLRQRQRSDVEGTKEQEDVFQQKLFNMPKPETAKLSGSAADYQQIISEVSNQHGVPESLISAMIRAESNYNPKAVSAKGAVGLMQLMPETARSLGVRNIYDSYENIEGGTRYLKQLLDKFDGNLIHSLAAYNAGPGAVERYGGVPPYEETNRYIKNVLKYYLDYS